MKNRKKQTLKKAIIKEVEKMKEKITVSATGDALFVADIPEEYAKDMEFVSGYIKNTDV